MVSEEQRGRMKGESWKVESVVYRVNDINRVFPLKETSTTANIV